MPHSFVGSFIFAIDLSHEGKATDVSTFDAVKKKLSFHNCFRSLLPLNFVIITLK